MIIKNVKAVLKDRIQQTSILIEDGIIKAMMAPDADQDGIDGQGLYAGPGVVDIHCHGAGGFDYMDGTVEDILGAAHSQALNGTTTCLPTALTCSDNELFLFLDNFSKAQKARGPYAHMEGIHMEGPYFDMEQKGAQDPRYIRNPSPEHYCAILQEAQGSIRRWSLAPEKDGAVPFMKTLAKEGILISAGHTAATYDDISRAYDMGMNLLTHFYSGMSSITRKGGFRVLGTVESGYLIEDLCVELISDGMHLPPELLALIFKMKRHDRIIACSDSMRGAGDKEGPSILGPKNNGTDCIIEDGIAKMPDRTCFAGSVATGQRLVKTLYKIAGLKLDEVFRLTSLQPAKLIGMQDRIGSIEIGKSADLILFDEDVNIKSVFISGEKIK
ncbi:MAG: N-acetylglucosamine-6-phosphate deacetylase [Sphaerochaetaceae bacterium]